MAPVRGGRGRGRGGRGGGRGRGQATRRPANRRRYQRNTTQSDETNAVVSACTFDATDLTSYKQLFVSADCDFDAHLRAQEHDKWHYLAVLRALEQNAVECLQSAKVRALAAAWARHDHELANFFLSRETEFSIVEVLKALTMLDAGRRARAEEKRIARLRLVKTRAGQKGKTRIGKKMVETKKLVNNFTRDKTSTGSASGAMARHIKKWTRTIPKERLEFFALHLTKTAWQQLADIVHLNPQKDFPQCPWFLKYCYGESAPAGTLAHECQGLTADNVNEYVSNHEVPFAHVKPMAASLNEQSKTRIARYTPDLDTLIWDYEDLACPAVDSIIAERLNSGEPVTLPYGKLMERMLMFRKRREASSNEAETVPFYQKIMPYAENMLKSISLPIDSPVVVIGDASASMDIAIQTSTIIASFLRAITNAELVFFSHNLILPKFIPESVERVLDLAMVTKTVGSTCHAAALQPYYEQKKVVKTFICCTDEEENTCVQIDGQSYRFLPLFAKYREEVYPAKLVFVSFLRSQHSKGQMVDEMQNAGLTDCVMQFKLDGHRPDLSKLDNMVGQLALDSTKFSKSVTQLKQALQTEGMQKVFDRVTVK